MTIAIVALMLLAYALIASEHLTHINKATTAMFAGVVGWILYLCSGVDQTQVAEQVFVGHSAYMCSIVLYLLSTMAIVEVLSVNGCFDFITEFLRTRSTKRFLWGIVLITFLLSANLDNLTTVVLMLIIMRRLLSNSHQRLLVGAAIVIAASCGGSFTVIGDVSTLMIWTKGAVTPTAFAKAMLLPALVATAVPVVLISYDLPTTLDIHRRHIVYRGDDHAMPLWQRVVMLFFGIVGLWLVPTFHRITQLPPFLGSLCVLGVVWVLNEVFNRSSIRSEQPVLLPGSDRRLQYEVMQVIMFFIGVALSVSVLIETGVLSAAGRWVDSNIHDIYVFSVFMGVLSAVLDNVCLVLSAVSIYDVLPDGSAQTAYQQFFTQNGAYWHLVVLSACVGGCLLPIGSTAGYALLKSEDTSIWWYFRHISGKVLLGWIAALIAYFGVDYVLRFLL
ncbi:MAG: sodium:proton antiporter [Bacteroidaceae bacterium]|nr:sodium:proton antiporter [Bacteroidaceae bacterium]